MEGFLVPFGHRGGEIYILGNYIYWEIYIRWLYMLVMDISCQHLGDECNLEGFLVPFGHRVGGMYILGLCISWINIFVLDIPCQHLGDECNLEGFLVPFGHRVGGMTNFWNMCKLAIYICLYWIYIANYLGMKVSCTCSNCS